MVNGASRCRFGLLAEFGSRIVLTLGQPIDSIVEEHIIDIEIATDRMNEMVTADRQGITIAGDYPDAQIRIRTLDPSRYCRRTSMNAVKSVGVHVIRETRRTTDA